MLSPSTSATGSPSRNSAPTRNAWAIPFGSAWVAYRNDTPNLLPSPSSASNRGRSTGVVMIKMSRMPACIRVAIG